MIELLGVIFSLFSVILTVKKSIWSWIHGIVGIFFYAILFYQLNLLLNFGLQFIFLIQSIYGIYNWRKNTIKDSLLLEKMNSLERIISSIGVIFIFISLSIIVPNLNVNKFFDNITTSFSIVAIILLSIRKIENWIFWIIANIFYICMFINQEKYLSSLLYLIFLILCIIGIKKWKKEYNG